MREKQDLFNKSQWEVELDIFEGPLDLLLHLIRTLEVDIYDIPIAKITDQYLEYIEAMKYIQMDVASDYLVMAATLMQIKSEMLVPRNENHSEELKEMEPGEEDPRKDLVEMLLEYKKFKAVSSKLQEKERERSDFHTKLPSDVSAYQQKISLDNEEANPLELFELMKQLLKNQELKEPNQTTIQTDTIRVFDQIEWITKTINKSSRKKIKFSELLKDHTKPEIVATFLAVLELMKKNKVKVKQESAQEEINIILSEE